MKPIEPGCLALVLVGEYSGQVVTVGHRAICGEIAPNGAVYWNGSCEHVWLVYGDVVSKTGGHGWAYAREKSLMRIDGHEEKTKQREAETV